ncbi:MAG: hypothetical protein MSC30_03375 [Gaiellaceae bacterium MAG52_C11]|nr:hypothetical protein [Candidatus Gaiellasilicea maunaloa]
MEGYDVLTFDDERAGTVVGKQGSNLIVEQGAIFKHRRALPELFVTVDEGEQIVRATVSKNVLESAPEVGDDGVDERAVSEHYGLTSGDAEPVTLGDGSFNPDDPARTAEAQGRRSGIEPAAAERARIQQHQGRGQGPNDHP